MKKVLTQSLNRAKCTWLPILLSILAVQVSFAARYYVATNGSSGNNGTAWATPKDLQSALSVALAGDEIWVKAGTYTPTTGSDRTISFVINKNIQLYGGFAGTEGSVSARVSGNTTILSGNIGGGSNSQNVVKIGGTDALTAACVVDGLTISDGRNDNGLTSGIIILNGGAGMFIDGTGNVCAPTITNCIFSNNTVTDGNGGAVNIFGSNPTISNCVFSNNQVTSFSDLLAAYVIGGGALAILGSSNQTITNCVFANNRVLDGSFINPTTDIRGGAVNSDGDIVFKNCVFYENTAPTAGAIYANELTAINCTFVVNRATQQYSIFYSAVNNTITNCVIYGNPDVFYTFNYAVINYSIGQTVTLPTFNSPTGTGNQPDVNPFFFNTGNPIGNDGKWGTADDGYQLLSISTAIKAGSPSVTTPTTDITGATRTGRFDLGAYESACTSPVNTPISVTQNVSNTLFTINDCRSLGKITPNGGSAVSGVVAFKSWYESSTINSSGTNFVNRHFEITPNNNPTTVTGRITFFFQQSDFDLFNAASATDLPTGPSDAAGKNHLKIVKYAGSGDGNGLPNSYSGARTIIDPADADIVWNANISRWEVTFDVTGFSGFFVATDIALPIELLSFSGKNTEGGNLLTWQTANEVNNKGFNIERQIANSEWTTIGFIAANNKASNYQFLDDRRDAMHRVSTTTTTTTTAYYRLRQIDNNGTETLSKIIAIQSNSLFGAKGAVKIYPSVVNGNLTIEGAKSFNIVNSIGQVVLSQTLISPSTVNIQHLPSGMYVVKGLDTEGGVFLEKIIKQ